ncbi:MAG: LysM peptidoglycan-binding domain-containing protein [Candidatus Omnitrophota bacterium]
MRTINKLKILASVTIFLTGMALGLTAYTAAAPDNGTTVYLVRPGDCLSTIAKRHGTTVAELVRLNRLSDPNILSIGQPILINIVGGPAPASVWESGKAPPVNIFVEKEPVDPDYLKIKNLNKKLNNDIQIAQYRQALETTEQILAAITKFKEKLAEVVEVLP